MRGGGRTTHKDEWNVINSVHSDRSLMSDYETHYVTSLTLHKMAVLMISYIT